MTNLPQITNGTDKQIAYATAIRDAAIKAMEQQARARAKDEAQVVGAMAHMTAKLAAEGSTDAVVWIEACHKRQAVIENGVMNINRVRDVLADVLAKPA